MKSSHRYNTNPSEKREKGYFFKTSIRSPKRWTFKSGAAGQLPSPLPPAILQTENIEVHTERPPPTPRPPYDRKGPQKKTYRIS